MTNENKDYNFPVLNHVLKELKSNDPTLAVRLVGRPLIIFSLLLHDERESASFKSAAKSLLDEIRDFDIAELDRKFSESNILERVHEISSQSSFESILEEQTELDEPLSSSLLLKLRSSFEESILRSVHENVFFRLEKQWRHLSPSVNAREWHRPNTDTAHPITEYIDCVWETGYPPPEFIFSFVICFQRYLRGEGDISLDEAFFGRKHSKRKSIAYLNRTNVYSFFLDMLNGRFYNPKSFFYKEWVEKYGKLTRTEMAEAFISEHPHLIKEDTDPETFLRGYDRWMRSTFKDKSE